MFCSTNTLQPEFGGMVGFIDQGDSYKPSFAWCFFAESTQHPKGTTTLPKNQQKNSHLFLCLAVNQHHLRGVLFWSEIFGGVFCRRKFKQGKTWAGWLVVEPTHLKHMLVKLDHFPRDRVEKKKYLSCHPLGGRLFTVVEGRKTRVSPLIQIYPDFISQTFLPE